MPGTRKLAVKRMRRKQMRARQRAESGQLSGLPVLPRKKREKVKEAP